MPDRAFDIGPLDPSAAAGAMDDLVDLLVDAVDDGASVGFLGPLARGDAERYWTERIAEVAAHNRVLLVAREDGRIVGSVQLAFASQQNAAHRAEVQRLLVHRRARRRGLGRALMLGLEAIARDL